MHRLATTAAASVLLAATASTTWAGENEILSIGDPAPAVDIAHWMKLGPNMKRGVKTFEPGRVYVLEFWATWCGPCKKNMPHVSEIQERFADYDVSVIGVSDEPLTTVFQFMTTTDNNDVLWADKAQYTLATDPDRSVHFDYMTRAGQGGIPTAFIIGKTGEIEWIGNPGYPPGAFDKALNDVVHDTWDRAAFAKGFEETIAPKRDAIIQRVQLETARRAGDWGTVMSHIDAALEKQPGNLRLQMQKFELLATDMNRPTAAYALGHEILESNWDNHGLMNHLAWMVATDTRIASRDLSFAMKAGQRAAELSDYEDPAILDTLARVYYEQGNLPKAIELQTKAVQEGERTPMLNDLRTTLARYENEVKKLKR